MTTHQDIETLLQAFQEGYVHRDVNQLDAFMELFTPDVEIIGTNGITPGAGEWYTSRDAAREWSKAIGKAGATCAWRWHPPPSEPTAT